MNEQPEALRLADVMEQKEYPPRRVIAAELRRLHEVNEDKTEIIAALSANNQELLMALKNVTVHLIAAHSLLQSGGKKAAPSNKMFELMLNDYEKSFECGRAAIAKAEGETK